MAVPRRCLKSPPRSSHAPMPSHGPLQEGSSPIPLTSPLSPPLPPPATAPNFPINKTRVFAPQLFLLPLLLILTLQAPSCARSSDLPLRSKGSPLGPRRALKASPPWVGINWGTFLSSSPLPPREAVRRIKGLGASAVKLFGPDRGAYGALSGALHHLPRPLTEG